ncbi:hypothetical protein SAMN05444422_11537 [Halobiforma haloterrestris]|uniref:Uncharacterized protein n=1 Tax=Natronobacterium haloterrestre TaxID=148448 RepID=A0A1I1L9K8_NATHA|nr:hypothetical protein SAMN05444422_11537 [Halobiforma haloterrestris]
MGLVGTRLTRKQDDDTSVIDLVPATRVTGLEGTAGLLRAALPVQQATIRIVDLAQSGIFRLESQPSA